VNLMSVHNHSDKEYPSFSDVFLSFSNRIEKTLLKIFFVLFVILILLQMLLQSPDIRKALVKVERLEGVPFKMEMSADHDRSLVTFACCSDLWYNFHHSQAEPAFLMKQDSFFQP
jgi:hypothetical protein